LKGKRALVTGGTKGIGAATVNELTALGADVLFVARTANDDPRCLAADVTTEQGRDAIATAIEKRWGALDILVNNAGMNIRKSWVSMSASEEETVIGTNVMAPARLLRLLQPLLAQGNSPAVVNVASVAAYVDVGSGPAYAMAKAAMLQLTR